MKHSPLIGVVVLISLAFISAGCSKNSNNNLPDADQYITWNLGGATGQLTSPHDSLASARYSSSTHVAGSSPTSRNTVYLIFDGPRQTGTYDATLSELYIAQKSYLDQTSSLRITVSRYEDVGGYIVGSYSANVRESASTTTVEVTGNFRMKTR